MMVMQTPTCKQTDGAKHKLKPLKDIDERACSASRVCFVDGNKFLNGVRQKHMCFFIIPEDGRDEVEEVPIEVENLLEVLPDNVLDGLSTMRNINY